MCIRDRLCRYCFYSRPNFGDFHPAGATRCTDQGQIWQGGADPSGETMDGTQKHMGPKMMAQTTSITMQNLVEMRDARRRERTKCNVFHFFCLFVFLLKITLLAVDRFGA